MTMEYGNYPLRETPDGTIIIVTEQNTRITYVGDDGRVQRFKTAKAQARYDWYQRTLGIRRTIKHYTTINSLLRTHAG